eukprot:1055617-Amphidinium_carterae.1
MLQRPLQLVIDNLDLLLEHTDCRISDFERTGTMRPATPTCCILSTPLLLPPQGFCTVWQAKL